MTEAELKARQDAHLKPINEALWRAFDKEVIRRLGGPRESPQPNPHCDTRNTSSS